MYNWCSWLLGLGYVLGRRLCKLHVSMNATYAHAEWSSRWSLDDRSSASCKITRITWKRKSAYSLIKVQSLQLSTGRRKMKFRLHLYEICCVVTKLKSYMQIQQYLKGPRYKIDNKMEALQLDLSRLKIISCFLFRCQKRSSNWIIHYICWVYFLASQPDCQYLFYWYVIIMYLK